MTTVEPRFEPLDSTVVSVIPLLSVQVQVHAMTIAPLFFFYIQAPSCLLFFRVALPPRVVP